MIENPDVTTEELMTVLPGPDFLNRWHHMALRASKMPMRLAVFYYGPRKVHVEQVMVVSALLLLRFHQVSASSREALPGSQREEN